LEKKLKSVLIAPTLGVDILNLTRVKTTDAAKLQDEYAKLVEGLQDAVDDEDTDGFMANPRKIQETFSVQSSSFYQQFSQTIF
jgi:hypothetical protein